MNDLEETARQQCKRDVLAELASVGVSPDKPVDLYIIGQMLVTRGDTQQQIVGTLDMLAYEKRLAYVGGYRVRLTR